MKIQTSELTDAALDWAVAKCEGRAIQRNPMGNQGNHGWWIWEETPSEKGGILLDKSVYMEIGPRTQPKTRNSGERFTPSTDWAQGGLIIDREHLMLEPYQDVDGWRWVCYSGEHKCDGPTALIAAMRCYVESKMGDEVEIPEELTQ